MTTAKLTAEDAREMREQYFGPERPTLRALAAAFDVSYETVRRVVSGEGWADAGGPTKASGAKRARYPQAKFREALRLWEQGFNRRAIESVVGCGVFAACAADLPPRPHPNATLTEDEVVEIRTLYASRRWTIDALAERFGLEGGSTVSAIVRGRTYKRAGGPIARPGRRIIDRAPNQLESGAAEEMRRLYAEGETQVRIARRFGVSQSLVSNVVRGLLHADEPGPIARDRVRA